MLVNVSGVFAILALLLTALGMYGLLMRTVVLRTREIGIRISLGAKRNQVVISVAKRAIIEIGIGLFTGAAMTIFLMQGIQHLLESVPSAGASTYLIGACLILLVSAVAVFFPARRAASVDPIQALRSE